MNKVTKLTGLALASAAATLLISGCANNADKAGTDKAQAKVEAKATNSCSGKNSCKGKDSCKGKNSCSGKK